MIKKVSIIIIFLLSSLTIFGQTPAERKKIIKNYDQKKLHELAVTYKLQAEKELAEAIAKAKKEGWKIKGEDKNGGFALIRLTPDGKPVYYHTNNYYAARTIRTNKLYDGGGLGINIQGQNMIVGVWDGGPVRLTHNFLNGRVTQKDGITFTSADELNRHATHVTGTMIANGVIRYRGMAFNASAWAHDWYNDESEMALRASEGLLVSNHSYGTQAFNDFGQRLIEVYRFGKYDREARNWDNIMYNAPYYLVVDAAGNDRYHQANGTNKGGYDMLTGHATGKNGITVAAVRKVSSYNGPNSVQMSGFSNWGPTDDGRIKPNISAQGVSVSSCISDSNTATDTYDGTSMAAPSVTGSLILLQQLYNKTYGNYILSSTLKGLTLHTADEAGSNPGPDYSFGWGLMNTAKAAQAILDNGLKSIIKEITLKQGETYSFDVKADGTVPLMASICWTDPAGRVITGTIQDLLDNDTPVLVNDLDIRITKNGTTYYPWKLNPATPSAAATKADNIVDNFERVDVNNPSGIYTITISHKGNLQSGKQKVSIVVTGISNPFSINTSNGDSKSVCSDNNTSVTYDLIFKKSDNITGATTFTINGLPSGANAVFTPESLSGNGNFSLKFTGLNNVNAGKYTMEVVATNGNNTVKKSISLHVLKNTFSAQNLLEPNDGATYMATPFTLKWEENPNAEKYNLQIAYDSSFNNLIIDENVTTTSYVITENTYGISHGTTYYWRVKPINSCAQGDFSASRSFTTQKVTCYQEFNSTAITIPSVANTSPIESTINYSRSTIISRTKVYVDITHGRISDLEIKVVSPSNTEVVLNQSGTCTGDYSNIQVTYDDLSENYINCNTTPPALNGDMKPYEGLSQLNGENAQGEWKLIISDPVAGQGGKINMWALEICEVDGVGVDETKGFELFKIWPNPSNSQINIELKAGKQIKVKLLDMSGRIIFDKDYDNTQDTFTKTIMFGNLKKGTYLLYVASDQKQAVKPIIIK